MIENQPSAANPQWERKVIETMVLEVFKEQRRNRRWKIFFRLVFLFIFIAGVALIFSPSPTLNKSHIALINIKGLIVDESKNSGFAINKSLNEAFADKNTKGVILSLNSGGGSAVQASMIFDEIIRLKEKYPNTKVLAVCSDICASGAYYIAAAADEIYSNESSLIGSIGVRMSSFGFVDSIDKLGIQRRLVTAGNEKAFLDPFSPEKSSDKAHMQTILNIVHQKFIADVKKGRGNRLHNDPDLFSGLIWTGKQSQDLGLIDHFGNVSSIARDVFAEENIVDYSIRNPILKRFTGDMSSSFVQHISETLGLKQRVYLE
jgi:protease IV